MDTFTREIQAECPLGDGTRPDNFFKKSLILGSRSTPVRLAEARKDYPETQALLG
jgi:hypothetical protein